MSVLRSAPWVRLSRHLALLGGLAAALAVAAAPSVADACSCWPTLTVQAPRDGATHPSNGLLLIESDCGGDPSSLEVYVDGEQASLVPEQNRMVGLGYRIMPEPEPGATVDLVGPEDDFSDSALQISFTVGERDQTAPQAPTLGDLDYVIEDVQQFCAYTDEDPQPAREWSLDIHGQADEPVLYHVTLGPAGASEPTRTRRVVLDGTDDLEVTLLRFAEDAGHDVCATVRTFDLTGNEADSVTTCTQLDRRDTLQDQGCACSAGGGSRGGMGAALLLLLGGWARRRRAGRR